MSPRRFVSKRTILQSAREAAGQGLTRPQIATILGLKNSRHLILLLDEMVSEQLLVKKWDNRPYPPRWVYFTPQFAPSVDVLDFTDDEKNDFAHYRELSAHDQMNYLYALAGYDVAVGVAS